jgi:catalase
MSFAEPQAKEHKVRGKPEKFAEHYNQATLFWNSQTDIEKQHIINAFRFELTKVQVAAIRHRVVAQLRNVAEELANGVAAGLGITTLPAPLPLLGKQSKPEVVESEMLSLFARPGTLGIRSRRIAIIVADGIDGLAALRIHKALADEGAVPRFVGPSLGTVQSSTVNSIARETEVAIEVEISLDAAPSVLWDASVFVDGEAATSTLAKTGYAMEFLKDQYRHCKPILLMGSANALLQQANIPATLEDGTSDAALLQLAADDTEVALAPFIQAVSNHRYFERETNPPRI